MQMRKGENCLQFIDRKRFERAEASVEHGALAPNNGSTESGEEKIKTPNRI